MSAPHEWHRQIKRSSGFPYGRLADADPNAHDPIIVQPEVDGQVMNGYPHGIESALRPIDR